MKALALSMLLTALFSVAFVAAGMAVAQADTFTVHGTQGSQYGR